MSPLTLLLLLVLVVLELVCAGLNPNFTLVVGGDYRTTSPVTGKFIDSLASLQEGHGSDWHAIGNSLPFPFKDVNGRPLGYEVFAMKILSRERLVIVGGSFQGNGFKGVAQFKADLQMWDNMKGGLDSSVTVKDIDYEEDYGLVYIVGYSYDYQKFNSKIVVWNVKEEKWTNFEVTNAPVEFTSAAFTKVRVCNNKDGRFMVVSSKSNLFIVDLQTRKCSIPFSTKNSLNDFLLISEKDTSSISVIVVGTFSVDQIKNSARVQFNTATFTLEDLKLFGSNNSIGINSIVFDSVNSKYFASRVEGAAISLDADSSTWTEFGTPIGYMAQIFTMDGEIFIGNSDCSSGYPFYRFDRLNQRWQHFLLDTMGKYENCILNYWITTESSIIYNNYSSSISSSDNPKEEDYTLIGVIFGSVGGFILLVLIVVLIMSVLFSILKKLKKKNGENQSLL